MPARFSASWALMSLFSARAWATAGPDRRWYSHTMPTMAGASSATMSISRQSKKAMATKAPMTTMPESSITYSTWR